jgi:RNA recognition motif-containing protein
VCGLNPRTTEKDIEEFFDQYGKVKEVKLVKSLITGMSKCYGFVEYHK